MVAWTEEQEKAITARNSNLLVAAAAGSGKTAVLVERIIQLIVQDKVDIDRLLIVTFTNAAAGEMRERISASILAQLEKKGEDQEHLRKQLNLLSGASISTLHSFCTDVVRKYFHLIDIDPNFRIGDATETDLMKLEAMEEVFEAEYEQASPLFLGLVEMFGGDKDDKRLQDLVLSTYEFIQSRPYPEQWLAEKVEEFTMDRDDFEQSPWVQTVIQHLKMQLSGAEELFREAKRIAEKPGGPERYREAVIDDLLIVDNLRQALDRGLSAFYDQLQDVKHKSLKPISKDVDQGLKEEALKLRNEGKDILKSIQSSSLTKSPEQYLEDLHALYPFMKHLHRLVVAFTERYQEMKAEKGIVDFNDLEHYALAILGNEAVAQEYRQKFAYIFVDEYQDSNLVQETILDFIKRDDNLFLVGDVKQSIYRFRLADPSLFMEKYETYENEDGALNRRIDLSKNFRSRKEIIDGVNFIFKHIMSRDLGEIDYDERAYLYQGAESKEIENPAVELLLVDKSAELDQIDEELAELEHVEVEARLVASRIKRLVGEKIYDPKLNCYRHIDYKDIVVLLRTTQEWAQIFTETFTAEGIPTYADVNSGYFQAVEVNIFINLLKVIDNKRQDIPLLSVMRSPIGKFDVADLIKIRVHSDSFTYFEAVEQYMADGPDDRLKDKIRRFVSQLTAWKEEARFMPLHEFIWKLMLDTGYYYYAGAMPGGVQRQANLRILLDRARQFQRTSIKGLFNFIKFVDKLKQSSGDLGTAKVLGENDNVVRIMSIHKSKGLEFPVVIVAGLGKQFNLRDTTAPVLFHKDLGLGPKYIDPEVRGYTDTIARIAMQNRIKLESLAEEMRLLYVACTRPKDKLILVGSVSNLGKTAAKWAMSVGPFNLAKGRNYLDWIGTVLMRHRDGLRLRELAGVAWEKEQLWEDASKWVVEIVDRSHIAQEKTGKNVRREEFLEGLEGKKLPNISGEGHAIASRLNWYYPHQEAVRVPSKLSVTQIKRFKARDLEKLGITIPRLVTRPKFVEGKKRFTAIEKGIIVHFVMQHLDLGRVGNVDEINEQVRQMVVRELLKEEEAQVIEIEKILNFFRSDLGRRVLEADKVYREVPFNLVRKACHLIDGLDGCQDDVLVQGVIDLYFQEGDGLVLVDYKTDFITGENREEIVNKYSIQVALYKEALESILGQRVKESYLYLLDSGEAVRL